jgi:hypothetical protein
MRLLAIVLCLLHGVAHAAGPLLGLEFESEKNDNSGITNHAVEIAPGWEFAEKSTINRVELLVERSQDDKADADSLLAKENKVFLRIRHDGEFSDTLGYYVRGGVGRSFNNERHFNFAYVEPGLEYKFRQDWAWTLALREGDSLDSITGKHVTQLRTGPSYEFDQNNEFELLYAKGHGDSNLTSVILEYVRRF